MCLSVCIFKTALLHDDSLKLTLPGSYHFFQGFSWFIDWMVLTVTTGRDGKIVVKWKRDPVPLTISPAANSYRGQNLPIPSRPAVKTCPYRQIRGQNLTWPSLSVTPSRQDAVNVKMPRVLWIVPTVLIIRIPNTYFICPSKDVGRRQFRPVTESGIISYF